MASATKVKQVSAGQDMSRDRRHKLVIKSRKKIVKGRIIVQPKTRPVHEWGLKYLYINFS